MQGMANVLVEDLGNGKFRTSPTTAPAVMSSTGRTLKFLGTAAGTGSATQYLLADEQGEAEGPFGSSSGYPLGAGSVSNLRAWGKNAINMAVDIEVVKINDDSTLTFTGYKVTFALHGGGPPVGQHLGPAAGSVTFGANDVLGLCVRIPNGSNTSSINLGATLDFTPAG